MATTKKPDALATRRARNSAVVLLATTNEIAQIGPDDQSKIPSRAVLARRWPALKINRLSWRWCDDRTGARGDDLASLAHYIGEAQR